jgi:hypothetical protein
MEGEGRENDAVFPINNIRFYSRKLHDKQETYAA